MRDSASQSHDRRLADWSIEGDQFPCSRPCCRDETSCGTGRSRGTAAAEMAWKPGPMQNAPGLDSGFEMATTSELRSWAWSGRSSSRSETWRQERSVPRRRWSCVRSSLASWLSLKACISLPLRRASICGHLRFGSVEPNYLRPDGRQGAYPALQCGHENGPAGHQAAAFSGLSAAFFGLAAKGDFGVARMAARPCMGRTCCPNDRQVMDARLARLRRGRRPRRSSGLRPSPRLWLRPSLRSWLHRSIWPLDLHCRWQRGLRAWRFADISTQPPHRNIRHIRGALVVLAIASFAPLALGAFAIASALAPQRFAGSTAPIALGATAIASALATHRLIASALASQRSGIERPRAWRLA